MVSPPIAIEGAASAAVSFSSWEFSLNGGSLKATGRMKYSGGPVQAIAASCVLDGAKQDGIVLAPTLQAGETGIVEVQCMMSNPDKIVLTVE